LEFVRDLSRQVIASIPQINEQRGVSVTFEEFGDSSINFSARFWINYSDYERFLQTRSDVIIALKKAFDENGITIPFPIRTIDFPRLPEAILENRRDT
jgi:small conductance mechanosensitive channel